MMALRSLIIAFGMVCHIPSRSEWLDNKRDDAGAKIHAEDFCGSQRHNSEQCSQRDSNPRTKLEKLVS